MTQGDLPARAAHIQRAVASTATCTAATVESLRSYLIPAVTTTHQRNSKAGKALPLKKDVHPAKQTQGTGSRARKQPVVDLEVSGAVGQDTPRPENDLQSPQRFRLATEVINASLKALTEAIKNPPLQKTETSLAGRSSHAALDNGSRSRSQNALQPICGNRVTNSPSKHTQSPRSSSTDERLDGLRAQAECTRIGFATLRSLQGIGGSPHLPFLQLETGMSALIGKLIALGFDEVAIKELRILRRRLETFGQTPDCSLIALPDPLELENSSKSESETLTCMLKYRNIDAKGPVLALIITSQLQALKILALRQDPSATEGVLQHLRLDVRYSPANMIQQQVEPGIPASPGKEALQLETLANLVIALCPSASTSEDHKSSKAGKTLSPVTSFQLQSLAFRIRLLWWKISGHQRNVMAELIEPFSRCLSAFKRRSRQDKKVKYELAKSTSEIVLNSLQDVAGPHAGTLLNIHQTLADLAEDSLQQDEAIRWFRQCRASATMSGASLTRLCTVTCRFAALQLRVLTPDSMHDALSSLQDATSNLRGNLQGDPADLDELLIAVASLRKLAFHSFQENHKPSSITTTQLSATFTDECRDIVLLCVNFMVRYLGNGSSQGESDKAMARREQRRRAIFQVANPTIESVAAMARLSARADQDVWQRLELGLRDCTRLVEGLEQGTCSAEEDMPKSWGLAAISNTYWARYLHLVRGAAESMSSIECLRTSIDIIKNRPNHEKVAGHLSKKLEKYAHLYENMREYKKATGAYKETLDAYMGTDFLMTLQESAATSSLQDVFENDAELGRMSKILLAYPRVALKAAEAGDNLKMFYDPEELAPAERGVFLEQQLQSVVAILLDHSSSPNSQHYMNVLANTLLLLYSEDRFPVRRRRVLVRLLALRLTRPDALDSHLQDQLFLEASEDFVVAHCDVGLLHYLPHLTASRRILISVCQPTPDIEGIKPIIDSWSRLVQEQRDSDTLKAHVCDIADWLMQLELLADYLEMQGLDLLRISVLNLLATIHESANPVQYSRLVSGLTELGIQYARLGYSGVAGITLHKAERYLETADLPYATVIRWYLSYAEYALVNGNLASCKESLGKAGHMFNESSRSVQSRKMRSSDLSEQSQLIADAYYVYSSLAAAEGLSANAIYLSRLSVRNLQRAWAYLERSRNRSDKNLQNCPGVSEKESLVEAISKLSLSERPSNHGGIASCISTLHAVAFWKLVARLFRGLTQTSLLFAAHGLVPEVRYYLQQSQMIAKAACAPCLLGQYFALLGQQSTLSGEIDEAASLLQQAEANLSSMQLDRHYAMLQVFLGTYHTRSRNFQASGLAFAVAENTISSLTNRSFLNRLICKESRAEDLELGMSSLTLQKAKTSRQTPKCQGRLTSKKNSTKSLPDHEASTNLNKDIPAIEVIGLNRIRGEINRRRINSSIREGNLEVAASLLEIARDHTYGHQCVVLQALLTSQLYFRQALEGLASDPVLCVIPESTVSCPSIKFPSDGKRRPGPVDACLASTDSASSKLQRNRGMSKISRTKGQCVAKPELDLLRLAQKAMSDVLNLARQVSSTSVLHEVSDALGNILMTLSASPTSALTLGNPISASLLVYVLEVGRIYSMIRQSSAIQVERQLCETKEANDWPSEDALEDQFSLRSGVNVDFATFQTEYIDIIPFGWTVVSISLSESHEDIFICKTRSGQAPFTLRLPLSRHSSMECDEETFGFEQAKAEMQDIVVLANSSAEAADDVTRKGAKTEWWKIRERLDARLKDLLVNIENIWLGGFRGIFSQNFQDQELLSRFQQSFQNLMDKHLPSRQQSGRGIQTNRVALDPHVLEMFVSLGCPSESNDVDEPLMDLLYFVVDILQFNGERNAYDEIDFDSLAIGTIDALRHYHQATKDEDQHQSEQHTILILDKNLQCFPWESLPCLDGQPISRLPSLGCLRDRILRQRSRQEQLDFSRTDRERFYIDGRNGASLLNPAGDLIATQQRLEQPLEELAGWENVIQREPTETEMKHLLEDHDLFLYFGHGSGGSFIRSRTIKKLQKCAVALLMGCSSGALTQAGEFEPYGMPINYMQAGCPALVANLWDVTDRDIDRFSQTVLEKWGLFHTAQPQSSPMKGFAKVKGKSKMEKFERVETCDHSPLALDQAVAKARASCKLRYLNGAAPVIYGVPVYLT